MSIDLIQQVSIVHIVNFKVRAFLFDHEYILKFLEIEQPFDPCLVFFLVDNSLRGEIGFNYILERAVIPQQTQLNDMVAELFPLHGLVAVDVHFLEEINQCQSDLVLEFLVFLVVVQMLQHAGHEIIHG